jgi:2-polyprenyl-3-methyl-5-hydroxy-6-metoxy-1,4-benzoquinol methylase
VKPCTICGATQVQTHLQSKGNGLSGDTLGSSRIEVSHGRILRCQSCGFGFSEERLSDDELARLYGQLDNKIYESQAEGRNATARRHLKILNQYLKGGHLLDVGCASGAFLWAAAEAGWAVTGIEPAKVFYEEACKKLSRRAEVFCTTLQKASFPAASFDAVTLWDVLEHVPEPVKFLHDCAVLLKPGGYLLLNVPNLDSMQARILGSRWPLLLPEHLNYFNRESLKLCGAQAQLRWVHFRQRPALFSISYVLHRLKQHRIPGASLGHAMLSRTPVGDIHIPVYLGEICGVWQRSC